MFKYQHNITHTQKKGGRGASMEDKEAEGRSPNSIMAPCSVPRYEPILDPEPIGWVPRRKDLEA